MSSAQEQTLGERVSRFLGFVPDPEKEYLRSLSRWSREQDKVSRAILKKVANRRMTVEQACQLVQKHDKRENREGMIADQTVYALRDLAHFLMVDETRGYDPAIDGAIPKHSMLIFGKSPEYPHVSVALHLPMYHFRSHDSKIEVYSPKLESLSKELVFHQTSPGSYSTGPITIERMVGDERARLIENIEKGFCVEHSISEGSGRPKHLNGVPIPIPVTWGVRFHWQEHTLDHREHLEAAKDAVVKINGVYKEYEEKKAPLQELR